MILVILVPIATTIGSCGIQPVAFDQNATNQATNAEIAFELSAGFHRRPAPDLPQQPRLLQIVEIAVDGHLRDREPVGQNIQVYGANRDQ